MITLTVNGVRRTFDGDPTLPLLWYLRDDLALTGTKYGCGVAQCGSCPVHVGGHSDAALRRAARHDGWISDLISTADAATHAARLDALRADAGRTGDFDVIVSLSDAVTADQFRRAEEVGVTDVLTMPWVYYSDFDVDLDQKIDGMSRFAADVLGPLAGET